MRLTKQQIEALAEDIRSGLVEEANKYKESKEYKEFENTLKDDVKYKALSKVSQALLEAKSCDAVNLDDYYIKYTIKLKSEYVDSRRKDAFKIPSVPTLTLIVNKIILNTIGINDLDALIEKVKDSLR
jgi:hypothetical protein